MGRDEAVRVSFDVRANDRLRGVVSLRAFYLVTGPLMVLFLAVLGGAAVASALWFVGATLLVLVELALFTLSATFATGSAAVDPARLPAGRMYYGRVLPDGTTETWVECPSPA